MLRLSDADNVLVAIDAVSKGATTAEGISALDKIMKGHKMAATDVAEGEAIRKFGQIIGFAKRNIAQGEWIHEHNTGMADFDRDYAYAQDARTEEILPPDQRATF